MLRQVPATIISYSTAITACEQAKEAQRALNLLERLKIQSYQPTLIPGEELGMFTRGFGCNLKDHKRKGVTSRWFVPNHQGVNRGVPVV